MSRYAGEFEHVFEASTAGVTLQAPQLDINTVAAGGGSRLFFRSAPAPGLGPPSPASQHTSKSSPPSPRSGLFVVGPESAGAHPGPACYRKGKNWDLPHQAPSHAAQPHPTPSALLLLPT